MDIVFEIMDDLKPNLIDQETKHALQVSLQRCHQIRSKFYSYILTVISILFLIIVFGGIVYYRFVNKPTPEQLYKKTMDEQKYILSKIRYYKEMFKENKNPNLITNLPIPGNNNNNNNQY